MDTSHKYIFEAFVDILLDIIEDVLSRPIVLTTAKDSK